MNFYSRIGTLAVTASVMLSGYAGIPNKSSKAYRDYLKQLEEAEAQAKAEAEAAAKAAEEAKKAEAEAEVKKFNEEQNGLTLSSEEKEVISDGITYILKEYTDFENKKVMAHVLEIDMTKADIMAVTPNYGEETVGAGATVYDEMMKIAEMGYTVYAGINADFFAMGGYYTPDGLCIKNYKVVHDVGVRPWFGITDEGKPIISTAEEYKKSFTGKIKEAVGGMYTIVKDGKFNEVGLGEEFAYTRHPRTSVGITENGNVVFMVVDGRQPEYSNGASLSDLAQLMIEEGCVEALNLDGGKSSTMLTAVQDGEKPFKLRNKPSDGEERKIYNSLVVVAANK